MENLSMNSIKHFGFDPGSNRPMEGEKYFSSKHTMTVPL